MKKQLLDYQLGIKCSVWPTLWRHQLLCLKLRSG